ncbi:hypothetical protein M5E87_15630 [Flavonifractor plautii]|nr:hypothetical protein M5E87_15630 [Flavonifractor plautii]
MKDLMSMFPLSDLGFAWLAPAVIGAVVGALLCRGKEKYQAMGDPIAEEIAKTND